ncbi:uncharacterized protein A1O9_12206 [Exophiala aquamarina CBS 119918]|uniref:Hydantoinase/oxoprolinase n=1 Tax=Exophiala aquamarina CBS 119918 TaxID=1182545 RepID=A0A072NXX1_9EURO|nr:uncharacterized protein A1O9_12206 [Exophiala aquamarina CBS 119918]KEF51868.1 hypothetical protein A1O9_12206 [Exophiala aquamarina CBS 119918]
MGSIADYSPRYRIGVDVGGTNTDAALAEARSDKGSAPPTVRIIDSSKSPTTSDVTSGICNVITDLLTKSRIAISDILSINIGTTHFVNAIVQADRNKLRPVGVLRLCGPFCREVPPFGDFPEELRSVLAGPVGYISGGLEIDGRVIAEIDEAEVRSFADTLSEAEVKTVVVNGVFAPLDTSTVTQEEEVKTMLLKAIPGIDIVCSRDIGRIGYLERENASILNAAILAFGRVTISRFQKAVEALGVSCPLYLTQNDGTVLDAYSASRTPIRTFSSGATNSLIGALFLSGIHDPGSDIDLKKSQVIMCDIGGTTSDFAALSPSGLPRQSPATVKVGGVRTAFSMPEVLSIGLGGGSKVSRDENRNVKVGPLSVGHLLTSESQCFGGPVLTATDIVVSSGLGHQVKGHGFKLQDLDENLVKLARQNIRNQIENGIDIMKTSDLPVVLLLVGGGSIILLDQIQNVAHCLQPAFSDVANAVGAAIAKISGDVDTIIVPGQTPYEEIKRNISQQAIEIAVQNGAQRNTVQVMEVDLIPLQYMTNGSLRAVAKAVGQLRWDSEFEPIKSSLVDGAEDDCSQSATKLQSSTRSLLPVLDRASISTYRPNVSKATGEWYVSPTDLLFIAEGNGILGTGGGGSAYTAYLDSLRVLAGSSHGKMRIVDPKSLKAGSEAVTFRAPSVSNERLTGDHELQLAAEALARYKGLDKFAGVMAAEIGGSNGMRAFAVATALDIPVIDADEIGRAFPRVDMSLPFVYKAASPCPAVLSDARANTQVVVSTENATKFENMARCVAVELGLFVGLAMAINSDVISKYCVHRSLSMSWFLGKAICTARIMKADIVDALISSIPGGRRLYSGKITDVSREVKGGWTVGFVTLALDDELKATHSENGQCTVDERPLQLQYQNEFLYAALKNPDSSLQVLCTTPDLISVLDQDGIAVGTHELRYGLRVSVISMPADPLWKTAEGMAAGGPKAFGLDIDYNDYGVDWQQPMSVIETFGV